MTMKIKLLLNLCLIIAVVFLTLNKAETSSLEELKKTAQQSDKVIKGNKEEIKKAREKRWQQTKDFARQIFTKFTKAGFMIKDQGMPTCIEYVYHYGSGMHREKVCMVPNDSMFDEYDQRYYFVVDNYNRISRVNDKNILFEGDVFETSQITEKSKDIEKAILRLISEQFNLPEDAGIQDIVYEQRKRMKENKDKENNERNKELNQERKKIDIFIPLGTELANTIIEILKDITKTTQIEFNHPRLDWGPPGNVFEGRGSNGDQDLFKNKRDDKLKILTIDESGMRCNGESQPVSSAYLIFDPRIKAKHNYLPWVHLLCGVGVTDDCSFGCQIDVKYGNRYDGLIGSYNVKFVTPDGKFNAKEEIKKIKSDLQEQIYKVLNALLQ